MARSLTLEEVQRRIKKFHGDKISVIPSSYTKLGKKAQFVDKQYGMWETLAANVTSGHGHPLRAIANNKRRYQKSLPEVIELIQKAHGDTLKVDASSYVDFHSKCIFIDSEFGKWIAIPKVVIKGVQHPKRACANAHDKVRLSTNDVIERLRRVHGDIVTLIETSYVEMGVKATFVDAVHGKWSAFPSEILRGRSHPNRTLEKCKATCVKHYGVSSPLQHPDILSKNMRSRRQSRVLIHWKTRQELTCVASYEVAFVNWCNYNNVDFDWQIPHKMPGDKIYHIDARIKDGEFANTWIEIKGYMIGIGKFKWEWFHAMHPENSQLWNRQRLEEIGILVKGKPNKKFIAMSIRIVGSDNVA